MWLCETCSESIFRKSYFIFLCIHTRKQNRTRLKKPPPRSPQGIGLWSIIFLGKVSGIYYTVCFFIWSAVIQIKNSPMCLNLSEYIFLLKVSLLEKILMDFFETFFIKISYFKISKHTLSEVFRESYWIVQLVSILFKHKTYKKTSWTLELSCHFHY